MMMDGAGSLYPSEVAVCPDTYKEFNLSSRAKGATEHQFTWLMNILRFQIKTIHPRIHSDGWS